MGPPVQGRRPHRRVGGGGHVLPGHTAASITYVIDAAAFIHDTLFMPEARGIDQHLVIGAAIFGVGWGLVGLCPSPALAGLGLAFRPVAIFVAAMLAGMAVFELLGRARPLAAAPPSPAPGKGR